MENSQIRQKLWLKTLNLIKEQVSTPTFRTWFGKVELDSEPSDQLIINVPSTFVKDQLSSKLRSILESSIEGAFGQKIPFQLKVTPTTSGGYPEEMLELETISQPSQSSQNNGLNPKYNLENFMVGLSNNLAYAAAQAVIQNPGQSYNPLFIYGGTGVGKTHLMHGVGNALIGKNPRLRIIYCSSEKFTNDFIQSIQTKRTGEFRARYRNCDLFLIDDIQFISGRDSTQEEFFHTFNELHSKNSQIILTSDRPPNEMEKLESRLMSRFQGGLMVDIQSPDFDTRVAILKAKCQERGDLVPQECLTLIAENMTTNARELEGKLVQIVQSLKLTGQAINIDTVQGILGKPQVQSKQVDQKKVLPVVTAYFSIKMSELTGHSRKRQLVIPRHLAMYLLYEECKVPYQRIGDLLGGRDHTTILHGVEKIRQEVSIDKETQRILIEIKQSLAGN